MKTKIKRHSRSVLAVVLTLCMLVSCMTLGIIATDAAKTAEERVGAVDGNEAVGATSVKFYVVNKCNYAGWYGDNTTYFYQSDLTDPWHGDSLPDIGHFAFLGTYDMTETSYSGGVFSSGSGSDVWNKSADTTIYNTGTGTPKIYIINQDGSNSTRSVTTKDAKYFLAGKVNGNTNWNRTDYPFTYSNGTWSIQVTLKNGDEIKAALGYDTTYAKGGSDDWCVSHGNGNNNFNVTEDGDYIISFTDGAADATSFTIEKLYTVSFNANGHGTAPDAQKVPYNTTATKPSTLTETGWTHDGNWYTESGCTTQFDFSTAITANTTLYAKWTAKTSPLTFNTNGATSNGTQTAAGAISATYDSAMPTITGYVAPSKTGYSLDGWYTATVSGGSVTSWGTKYYNANGTSARSWNVDTTSGTTLYAKWVEVKAGATVYAYTDGSASGTGGTVKVGTSGTAGDTATISNDSFGISTNVTVLVASTTSGYTFKGWETGGTYGSHVKLYIDSSCSTEYVKATHGGNYETIYVKTDGYTEYTMTTANTEIHALFESTKYTITFGGKKTDDGSTFTDLSGAVTAKYYDEDTSTGEGTTMTSPATVPYGKIAEFTAEASKTVSGTTYYFAEWVDGSSNTLSTDLTYTVKVTAAQSVYARYYKVYKLSAFDSYTSDGTNVTFVTSPPKTITVKHGDDYYIYNYDGTKAPGNSGTPDISAPKPDPLPMASGTYGQGNYIQYYVGDEITLYYSAMASSEIFKGVFYNDGANFYVNKPTQAQYVAHDYAAEHTLYMNSTYYTSVPSGLPTTTVDHDAHSIKFTGTQDYRNIDVETATKRKVYFSDYTNAVIGSKNTDDYYYDGEALSVTGDQLTVKAAGSATQTNSITASNVKFYRADANGQPTGSELSGFTVAYDSGSTAVTNSGTTASTRYIIISGSMPSYDLYIDLGMTNSYTIKLGNKIVSDELASKTRLAEVADITISGGTATLTASSSADVTSSTSVNSGTALTLTTAWQTGWSQYYTFVGWYWGSDSAPDYTNGFISDKLSLSYTPKKGGTIWAVGTRSLFINGSKYITGKDTDWYGENNVQKNLPMSYDVKSGRYYWEITDTMFAAAGSNYKTWSTTNWNEKHTDYGVYAHSDAYYWTDNDDEYHGKSFFQILDQESGNTNKEIWKAIESFKVDTPANGPTYGKVYRRDEADDNAKKTNGQGFINFNETDYSGQSSPLRIYYNPSATGNDKLTVESTKIYSNLYVSNGYTVGSTLKTSAVTVQPVVEGVVKTEGQTGYFSVGQQGDGWNPDVEGHVNHYKPQKKGATVRITKTAGGSDKIEAFFIYDITNKTVRAERNVQKSGSNYYIDLTLANEEQNLYIVPIVEEDGANVTITFDATQLNRAQWGDIVTAYAWYQNKGGNALGGYPGQPMIPSDDMTTWTTTFKGKNSSNNELEGITFSNYVDGAHSWLGCSDVMSTVTYGGGGTAENPTTVSFGDNGLIKQYNYIESGNGKEYSRGNFKAQTYDYREPIALYDRFSGQDHVTISFSMKDGNSSLISWRHNDLLNENVITEPNPAWQLRFEYLTNAKGDKYIDMNGNTLKTKPTASFYVAAKGLVLYNNSSMTKVFYSGKNNDAVSGVTYGGATGVSMNYAVQWYVYDASGNYITNVLTAGIADLASNNVDSYIGGVLEGMGYAVDGKSVAICYDKPRYMYSDDGAINAGSNFDAYRFTGQWNAVATNELVKVKVGVGMMTDSGEVLANSNTAAYGNAKAYYDTTKGNNVSVTNEDGDTAPFTASDNSFVRTAVRDAENTPVKLNASAQNFIGWYYYDANTGEFTKANYTGNENFYPSYSTKDVTFYAMYRASAVYQYKYTGREGARTYSASGDDLTADEMGNGNKINAASHEDDIKDKVPVDIGVFKKNIDFSAESYSSWTKTPDNNGYILDITGFVTSLPTYTLTAHYKDSTGADVTTTRTAVYNQSVVNLSNNNGTYNDITKLYGQQFLGWYEYDGGVVGDLISTQHNYGLRLTRDQAIIALYDENNQALPDDGWTAHIDENEVNKELTTVDSGVYYNDTIVRIRNGSTVTNTTVPGAAGSLPEGSKVGVLVVCDNKTNETINEYNSTQLTTLVGAVAEGKTKKTAKGLSITNLATTTVTQFNRTDLAVKTDYAKSLGAKYCVYAYYYDGSAYHFSAVSDVKTYE